MLCTEDYQGSQNQILHACVIPGDSRQKEKKTAKTRSKVKSSDEDGSPKSAQKKVKLLQPYVMHLLSILCLPFKFQCNHLNHFMIICSLSLVIHFLHRQRRIQQPYYQLWECAPIWCAGHAGGPKWTHLLSVPSGVLWRDDRLWQHWCEFWSIASFQCQPWVLWSDVWVELNEVRDLTWEFKSRWDKHYAKDTDAALCSILWINNVLHQLHLQKRWRHTKGEAVSSVYVWTSGRGVGSYWCWWCYELKKESKMTQKDAGICRNKVYLCFFM